MTGDPEDQNCDPEQSLSAEQSQICVRQGIRDALVGPLWLLGLSMSGFGALVRSQELDWLFSLLNTATAFALPGQVILVEMYHPSASLLAIWLAVTASSVRMLPMVVVYFSAVTPKDLPVWKQLLFAQTVAITAWINVLAQKGVLSKQQLWPYANGFGWTMYLGTLPFALFGYFVGAYIPFALAMAFLMFMPLYFAVLFSAQWKHCGRFIAISLGFIIGPPLFHMSPDWGLVLTGLIAGTFAFFAEIIWKKHKPKRRKA